MPHAPSRPYSTVAAIIPNKLYLIGGKESIPPQLFGVISPIHQNRHFFVAFERITAPISIIFGTNCQGQTGKGKLE
jgi:hypothetical protein